MPQTMYPDWPQPGEELLPLPRVDGPKLKPFDFAEPQSIEFLSLLGEGLHSYVFKVRSSGQEYALKLFRFCFNDNWTGPAVDADHDDCELMNAFYNYAEPFSCECRAYGRFQHKQHEELAVQCFGYILLDDAHERILNQRFPDLNMTGDDEGKDVELRTRFLGRDDRPPPIRGIVEELGRAAEESDLREADFKKVLRDIIQLHQLGMIGVDIALRQIVNGKLCDFSQAITTPHFATTPALNPDLTPKMIDAIELETFQWAQGDFLDFDAMMFGWNLDYGDEKGEIAVRAFAGGTGCPKLRSYELRNEKAREIVFTLIDPRKYHWEWDLNHPKKRHPCLRVTPSAWLYECGSRSWLAEWLRARESFGGDSLLEWEYRDGLIFPRLRLWHQNI